MTRQETTYQGWTNYETWNVNLWLTNDQASLVAWQGRATAILAEYGEPKAVFVIAKQLEEHYGDEAGYWLESAPPSCFSDLLLASLREVNWREIAEALLEDIQAEN